MDAYGRTVQIASTPQLSMGLSAPSGSISRRSLPLQTRLRSCLPCAHPFRAGSIGLRCRYSRQVQKNACMILGYRARAGPHNLGPCMGRDYEEQRFSLHIPFCGLPPSAPRCEVPRERIIVEAPGHPSAEDERPRRGGRLTAGLYNCARALLFAGCHIGERKSKCSQSSPSSSGAVKRVGAGA